MTCGLQLNIPVSDRSLHSRSWKTQQGKEKVAYTLSPHTHMHPNTLHYKWDIYGIAWKPATKIHNFQFPVKIGFSCTGGMEGRSASKATWLQSSQVAGLPAELLAGAGLQHVPSRKPRPGTILFVHSKHFWSESPRNTKSMRRVTYLR